jgi:hypothetical protein
MQAGHRVAGAAAGEQHLAGVAAKAVQPVVALGAEDPADSMA